MNDRKKTIFYSSISLRLQNETKGLMQQVNTDLKKFLEVPTSGEDQVRNESDLDARINIVDLFRREKEKPYRKIFPNNISHCSIVFKKLKLLVLEKRKKVLHVHVL